MIPQSIYSGQLKPLSIVQDQVSNQEKKVSVPDSLQVPVWEAYEKEKGNPGESTYQNTVDDYTKKLIAGVEDILPNVDAVVNVNEKGEKSLAINLWHNPYRTIVASYIPEPLEKWLDLTTVKEPVANSKDKWLLSGHIEGDKHCTTILKLLQPIWYQTFYQGRKEISFLFRCPIVMVISNIQKILEKTVLSPGKKMQLL